MFLMELTPVAVAIFAEQFLQEVSEQHTAGPGDAVVVKAIVKSQLFQ